MANQVVSASHFRGFPPPQGGQESEPLKFLSAPCEEKIQRVHFLAAPLKKI